MLPVKRGSWHAPRQALRRWRLPLRKKKPLAGREEEVWRAALKAGAATLAREYAAWDEQVGSQPPACPQCGTVMHHLRRAARYIVTRAGMTVVADAANGRTALTLALKHKPDVIIMDVSRPDMNGLEATRLILKKRPAAKIIALSIHSDPRFVTGMYTAGAMGYVLKDNVFEQLLEAVTTVMRGHRHICPDLKDVVVNSLTNPAGSPSAMRDSLTPRERQTLQLLAEGNPLKKIAQHLNVSVKTIETDRQSIGHKLGVHTLAQIIKLAVREGIISLEP